MHHFYSFDREHIKASLYPCVFKRHRWAAAADMIQKAEPPAENKAQTPKQTKLKPLVCWGMSEGFHLKINCPLKTKSTAAYRLLLMLVHLT